MLQKLLILILLGMPLTIHGQSDSILTFPKNQRLFVTYAVCDRWLADRPNRLNKLIALEKEMEARHETELQQLIWTLEVDELVNNNAGKPFEGQIQLFQDLMTSLEKKKWKQIENEMRFRLGLLYFDNKEFGPGLDMMMHSYATARKQGWSNAYAANRVLDALGHAYYRFGDYESALYYLKASQEFDIPKTNPGYFYKSQNTIGLCYQELSQYDSAIDYFILSHDNASIQQDSFWTMLTFGNTGNAFYKSGNFDLAVPFIEADYAGSIQAGEYGSAVNAAGLLANIAMKKGDLKKATEYIEFANTHIDTSSIESMVIYYENLVEYSKQTGDDDLAIQYADSLSKYQARKEKLLAKRRLDQSQIKLAIDDYNTGMKLLQAARSRNIMIRNVLFGILILSLPIVFIWIKRIRSGRKSDLKN